MALWMTDPFREFYYTFNELYAWGYNKFGQLGTGDTINRLTPQLVAFFNDKKIKKIEAGEYHSLALTESGDLYAWGSNANGELGITGSYQLTPQLVPFFSGKKVQQVATGGYHSLALTESGKLYAWGYNERGALGLGHTNDQSTPRVISFFKGKKIKSIAAGKLHSLVILESGDLYTWGQNNQGQLGVGHRNNELSPQLVAFFANNPIIKVAAGEYHTLALTEHDELYSWGGNNFGQLGVGDTAEYLTPHLITSLEGKGIKNFVAGSVHSIALLECGEVYVWGRSLNGELGLGSPNHKTTPQLLSLKANFVFIAAGGHHSCAVSKEGEMFVWGLNNNGSLGLNHTTDQQTPQVLRQLSDEKTILQAALGGFHTIALHGAKVTEKVESKVLEAVLDEWRQCRSLCDLEFLGEKWYSPLVKLNCPKLLKKDTQSKLVGTKSSIIDLLNQFVHFMDCQMNSIEEITELLHVAQLVSFKTLIKKCNQSLAALLTMENVWPLLKTFEKNDAQVDVLFDFIKKNKLRYGDDFSKLVQNNMTPDLKTKWTKYIDQSTTTTFKLSSSLADLKIKKLKHLFSMREETRDCEIKVGSVYIPAHKLILALHNDFFRKCFSSDMIESRKGVISIRDQDEGGISVSAMQGLMYYLYTSDLNHLQNVNDCLSILINAAFFCLSPETKPAQDHYKLIKHCQRVVLSEMCLENCLSILKIVWEHKAAILQDKILAYVVQHYFELNEKHEDQVLDLPNRLLWLITNRVIINQQVLIMQHLNVNSHTNNKN